MNPETNNTEAIECYLDGEMDQSEEQAFEQRIAKEPELANEVNLHRSIRFGIENQPETFEDEGDPYGALAFVQEVEAERAKKKTKRINLIRFSGLAIAAVIIVLFLIYLPNSKPYPPEKFIAEYQVPLFEGTKGIDNSNELQQIYVNGQYEKGLQLIEQFQIRDPDNKDYYDFATGAFYLQMKDSKRAISVYKSIIENSSPDSDYYLDSYQQLGIAYVMSNDSKAAADILQKLLQNDGLGNIQREEVKNMRERLPK